MNEDTPTPNQTPTPDPVTPTPPTPAQAPVISSEPMTMNTSKPKKKGLIIGLIVAGALVVLGGGGAAAYNLWYQNPDKVIGDALTNVINAKSVSFTGTMDVKADGTTYKISVTGKSSGDEGQVDVTASFTSNGTDFTLKGSGVSDKDGNLYVKLQDVRELLTQAFSTSGQVVDLSPLDSLIAKVDGKWVKVSADDLKDFSEDYAKTQTCTTDAIKKFNSTDAVRKEVGKAYETNRFLVVKEKLAAKNIDGVGSLGYKLTVDDAKATAFSKALAETTLGKDLKACDDSLDFAKADDDSKPFSGDLQVWVSRFGHDFTQVDYTDNSDGTDGTLSLKPVFNKPVTVEIPSDVTPLKDLITEFQNLLGGASTSEF